MERDCSDESNDEGGGGHRKGRGRAGEDEGQKRQVGKDYFFVTQNCFDMLYLGSWVLLAF